MLPPSIVATADVILAEAGATPKREEEEEAASRAMAAGCLDQLVERERLRGVIACILETFVPRS